MHTKLFTIATLNHREDWVLGNWESSPLLYFILYIFLYCWSVRAGTMARVSDKARKNQFPFDTKRQNKDGSISATTSSMSVDCPPCRGIGVEEFHDAPLDLGMLSLRSTETRWLTQICSYRTKLGSEFRFHDLRLSMFFCDAHVRLFSCLCCLIGSNTCYRNPQSIKLSSMPHFPSNSFSQTSWGKFCRM